MEEGQRKLTRPVGKERAIGPVANLAPFLVVDAFDDVGRRAGRADIGRVRHFLGPRLEEIERKLDRIGKAQSVGGLGLQPGRQTDGGRGRSLQDGAAINLVGHGEPLAAWTSVTITGTSPGRTNLRPSPASGALSSELAAPASPKVAARPRPRAPVD